MCISKSHLTDRTAPKGGRERRKRVFIPPNTLRLTCGSPIMSQEITEFIADLKRQEAAAKTVANYLSDLNCFARWFQGSTGDEFAASNITPTDIRDYRSHLQTTQGRAPATVN